MRHFRITSAGRRVGLAGRGTSVDSPDVARDTGKSSEGVKPRLELGVYRGLAGNLNDARLLETLLDTTTNPRH